MQTEITRPGALPGVLMQSAAWNLDAVRPFSLENPTWRAIVVTDETGPVGAVCYSEPDIYPHIIVDTILMHPERAENAQQLSEVLIAVLPILGGVAKRFKADRIVFEAASPMLRSLLPSAREDSVTVSLALGDIAAEPKPNLYFDTPALVAAIERQDNARGVSVASPCGRENKSAAGKSAHERHCTQCKEA